MMGRFALLFSQSVFQCRPRARASMQLVSFGAGSAGQNINGNASLQFKKRTDLFIGVHNEMLSVATALYHEETVQQTARDEPGFTGTYPGAVFMNQHGVESRLSDTG
jgi:hypothetical protein